MKSCFFSFLAILVFAGSIALYGQSATELPDAPTPAIESASWSSSMTPLPAAAITLQQPAVTKKHRWLNDYNFSLLALGGGEIVDSLGTHKNMTHPKWICGYNSSFGYSVFVISTQDEILYTQADMQNICGVSPSGVRPNYMFDVTQTNSFVEAGWAAKYRLAGNRNYPGVEMWNIANDVGQAIVANYLHKKGGWRGKIGTAMNYWHGGGHLIYGIKNYIYVADNRTPAQWAKNNDGWFNWPAPYWWGKK